MRHADAIRSRCSLRVAERVRFACVESGSVIAFRNTPIAPHGRRMHRYFSYIVKGSYNGDAWKGMRKKED